MISVAQAQTIIGDAAKPVGAETLPLGEAFARTLAASIAAMRALPPFRASAMDGYALRAQDTPGALKIVGAAIAGKAFSRELRSGEAVRIFTGAPVPDGADVILIQEDARVEGEMLHAPALKPGKHIRDAGIDFDAGETLLSPGRVLDGPALALAAAGGHATLSVFKRPRVAIVSGGDEIVPPGAPIGAAQIFESASFGIAGMAQSWGAAPMLNPPVSDTISDIEAAVLRSLSACDVLVMIGGASVGEHDHARGVLKSAGASLLFEKIAVRPGKPTWFAVARGALVLGLPGNPASAMVCARLFLRPLLDIMLGRAPAVETTPALLASPLLANGPRETYLRAKFSRDDQGRIFARAFTEQDSSLHSILAASDCLIRRAPGAPALEAGDVSETIAF